MIGLPEDFLHGKSDSLGGGAIQVRAIILALASIFGPKLEDLKYKD